MKNTNLENRDLRDAIAKGGFFQWQIAKRLGIAEPTLTRWLRDPLPKNDPRRQKILQILEGGGTDGKEAERKG